MTVSIEMFLVVVVALLLLLLYFVAMNDQLKKQNEITFRCLFQVSEKYDKTRKDLIAARALISQAGAVQEKQEEEQS